jgi:hypothetical protein
MNFFQFALFALVTLATLDIDTPAYAYLDPGTGAMILQAVFGGVAGALVFGRIFWGRIKSFFGRSDVASSSDGEQSSE